MAYGQPSSIQLRFKNNGMLVVKVIPYLVNWLFKDGLPSRWGK